MQAVRPAGGMGRRRRRDNISEEMPCDCVSVKCGAVNGGSLKSEARVALRSAELYRHAPPFPGFQQLNFEAASLQHISQKSTKRAAPDYIDWSLVCWSLGTLYLLVLLNLAAALEIERNKGQAHGALLVPADGKRMGLFSSQLAGICASPSCLRARAFFKNFSETLRLSSTLQPLKNPQEAQTVTY